VLTSWPTIVKRMRDGFTDPVVSGSNIRHIYTPMFIVKRLQFVRHNCINDEYGNGVLFEVRGSGRPSKTIKSPLIIVMCQTA
jgi:hypothetical protein